MGKKIGEILVALGYVKPQQVQEALEVQAREGRRRRLGEILRELYLREEQVLEALAEQWGMEVVSEEEFPEALPLERVSFSFLVENGVLPLGLSDGVLSVAIADPTRAEELADALRASLGYEVKLFLAKESAIREHLEGLYASKDALMQRLIEGAIEEAAPQPEAGPDITHLKDLAQEKGIVQLVNFLLEDAVKERASDVHIEPEETHVRVRYRIDGILYDRERFPVRMQPALSSRVKLISQMNIAERRLPQDGRIKGVFAGREVDIRVSTIPTIHGESIVMRILDKGVSLLGLQELGMEEELLKRYEALIRLPYGMILITGPTGSGKSTTLYASLQRINSPEKKIITIEEPVEYMLKGVNQIQVRPKIGLTFASGLRHIVRQDPDIIMVGEIRDLETANIAIHAALTGHLLFSTLHTNDAPSAPARLADMGVEPYLISSTLVGVMAQRLLRRLCPVCKEPYVAPGHLREELQVERLFRAKGCPQCNHTGYKGRIAIFELMVVDEDIRELITARATSSRLKEAALAKGMKTLRQDGLGKAARGISTADEVYRVTQIEL
jgi:type II secretion system protein E